MTEGLDDDSSAAPADGASDDASTDAPLAGFAVEAYVTVDPDDGTSQHEQSVQVGKSAKLTLNWTATAADNVSISDVGDGLALVGAHPLETKDATYTVYALTADGTKSVPVVITVTTHDDADVVSPHSDLSSGAGAIISFHAMQKDQVVTHACIGDDITLNLVVSEASDSATINGAEVPLVPTEDGHKSASVTVTLDGSQTSFACEALNGGTVDDQGSLNLDLGPAQSSADPAADPNAPVASTDPAATDPASSSSDGPVADETAPAAGDVTGNAAGQDPVSADPAAAPATDTPVADPAAQPAAQPDPTPAAASNGYCNPPIRNVPQWDTRWGKQILHDSTTWAASGCHPSSVAMVLRWYAEDNKPSVGKFTFPAAASSNVTDGFYAQKMCEAFWPSLGGKVQASGGNVDHDALMKAAQNALGMSSSPLLSMSGDVLATIKDAVTKGPVVVNMTHPGHFVVITGYRDGKLMITDPGNELIKMKETTHGGESMPDVSSAPGNEGDPRAYIELDPTKPITGKDGVAHDFVKGLIRMELYTYGG